jgi:flagellar basal body-associated protein FliL
MAAFTYNGFFGNTHSISDIHQITWIPIILYGLVFVFAFAIALLFNVVKKVNNKNSASNHKPENRVV